MHIEKDIGYPNGDLRNATGAVVLRGAQYRLRTEAAALLVDWNAAYRMRFGGDLPVNESFRDLAEQQRLYDAYLNGTGALAAVPGTSIHGWGLAIDVDIYDDAQQRWLRDTAPSYGWWWAGGEFSQIEPWHFEFDGRNIDGARFEENEEMQVIQVIDNGEKYLVTPNGFRAITESAAVGLEAVTGRPRRSLLFPDFWYSVVAINDLNRVDSALAGDDDIARVGQRFGV